MCPSGKAAQIRGGLGGMRGKAEAEQARCLCHPPRISSPRVTQASLPVLPLPSAFPGSGDPYVQSQNRIEGSSSLSLGLDACPLLALIGLAEDVDSGLGLTLASVLLGVAVVPDGFPEAPAEGFEVLPVGRRRQLEVRHGVDSPFEGAGLCESTLARGSVGSQYRSGSFSQASWAARLSKQNANRLGGLRAERGVQRGFTTEGTKGTETEWKENSLMNILWKVLLVLGLATLGLVGVPDKAPEPAAAPLSCCGPVPPCPDWPCECEGENCGG